jgi:hypothetical protein
LPPPPPPPPPLNNAIIKIHNYIPQTLLTVERRHDNVFLLLMTDMAMIYVENIKTERCRFFC